MAVWRREQSSRRDMNLNLRDMPNLLPEIPADQYHLPELVGRSFDVTVLSRDALRPLRPPQQPTASGTLPPTAPTSSSTQEDTRTEGHLKYVRPIPMSRAKQHTHTHTIRVMVGQ